MTLKISTTICLLSILFAVPSNVYADGAQLSSTQIGQTVRFTAQIPKNPCGAHNTGESKDRTVVGFIIDIHPIDDDGVVRVVMGKPKRADLSDATITEISIAGQRVTEFYEDPVRLGASNISEFLPMQRVYKLNNHVNFTPEDTASIVVDNVKILEKGKVKMWFGLEEPNGIFCLASKSTILSLGQTLALPTITPTPSNYPTKIISTKNKIVQNSTPFPTITKSLSINEKENKKVNLLLMIFNWIKDLI